MVRRVVMGSTRGGKRCTSDFIGAFGADSFVVEFADLALLGGGEGKRISRGVGDGRCCGGLVA